MDFQPGEIKKLDKVVINRIAAGEIVQRPANALKEMIENSLDAKSTNINISVKDGGLKLLQIQDNGTGIRPEDFNIVCERFTTSKLQKFEDLETISTYGFRGEALSSISHVAHLTITSKTKQSQCAYSASYTDGVLKDAMKPIAGNQGTIITVEDLFYNMKTRRSALRSPAEEFSKIADVVGKYAIHNSKIGFSLKKQAASIDIRTMQDSLVVDNIRIIYGQEIAKELSEFSLEDKAFKFKVAGQFTNVNYSIKKMQFILFINHRLVDCQNLKRRIDQIYTTYLPKQGHPFVYLSLEIDPHNVDVNVHPTKHEVNFLNEEQIVDLIGTALEAKLLGGNNSRTFYAQSKLPVTILHTTKPDNVNNQSVNRTIYDKDLIRTDMKEQKLEKFFGPLGKTGSASNLKEDTDDIAEKILEEVDQFDKQLLNKTATKLDDTQEISELKVQKIASNFVKQKEKTRYEVQLKSVLDLQQEIEEGCDATLREIFAEHVFVGIVTSQQALIQHGVRLLLIDTERLLEQLFYQCIIFNFQNFSAFRFDNPLSIKELVLIALQQPETGYTEADGDKEELATNAQDILNEKSQMLQTYFEVTITDGKLCSLPVLIEEHTLLASGLPKYIVRLACEVNWEDERACFETFARETAKYYSEAPIRNNDEWKHTVEHVLYPFVKEYFLPPREFKSNGAMFETANLPQLYKVFERC